MEIAAALSIPASIALGALLEHRRSQYRLFYYYLVSFPPAPGVSHSPAELLVELLFELSESSLSSVVSVAVSSLLSVGLIATFLGAGSVVSCPGVGLAEGVAPLDCVTDMTGAASSFSAYCGRWTARSSLHQLLRRAARVCQQYWRHLSHRCG